MIPFEEPNENFLTFKIMPRHVNSHAYVNAGFRLVTASDSSLTVDKVVIVYGGIGPHAVSLSVSLSVFISMFSFLSIL